MMNTSQTPTSTLHAASSTPTSQVMVLDGYRARLQPPLPNLASYLELLTTTIDL